MALSSLLTKLPSVTAPTGYSLVANAHMELTGLPGVSVVFDHANNIKAASNINGYAFNSNAGTHSSGASVSIILVSVWKKNA